MKIFSIVLLMAISTSSFTAFASDKYEAIDNSTTTNPLKEWSAEEHMAVARTQDQEAQKLIARIEKLVEQISLLSKKPYLDPKSLRRDSLRRITGNLIGELRTIQTQIAWHQKEANRLTAMNEKTQNGS